MPWKHDPNYRELGLGFLSSEHIFDSLIQNEVTKRSQLLSKLTPKRVETTRMIPVIQARVFLTNATSAEVKSGEASFWEASFSANQRADGWEVNTTFKFSSDDEKPVPLKVMTPTTWPVQLQNVTS